MRESSAWSASQTSATRSWGTITRRIAVHFWPVFWLRSWTTLRMKVDQASSPGPTSGPSTAALRLSASTLSRVPRESTAGEARSTAPVAAEPVKASMSWGPRWSSRSPTGPARKEKAPGGRATSWATIWAIRQATRAVAVAGLVSTGTPARMLTATFSKVPQAGKLKALMCTATPGRGRRTCWPT